MATKKPVRNRKREKKLAKARSFEEVKTLKPVGSVVDTTSYPLLTEEVGYPPSIVK